MLKLGRSIQISTVFRQFIQTTRPKHAKRPASSASQAVSEPKQNFVEVVNERRQEAKRSILVQVNSEKSFGDLAKYCTQFGEIKSAHHYSIHEGEQLHFILVEYTTPEGAENALNASIYKQDARTIPARSHFLWFRTGKNARVSKERCHLGVVNGLSEISEEELNGFLQVSESVNDQIDVLHKSTALSDLGTRLRFLAAQQIQNSISGMFPAASAHPFGSSVNGFGKQGCDLDLILRLGCEEYPEVDSRLVFHTKSSNVSNCRTQSQRYMESVSDLLNLFLPGVANVRRILQARVPIIKYTHEFLDLEVDLSMYNLTGVYMSELLFMFGAMDERVRPLTFCIRRWAKSVGLTNPSPGRWITNFSLTLLTIFFLQSIQKPILPPLNLLIKKARKEDQRITEDQVNCSFLRDINLIGFKTQNRDSLEELLAQFFDFYLAFNFANKGVSLNEGRTIIKPDHSAMYIVNPFEVHLNVSKNVDIEERERFRVEVTNAAWVLESERLKTSTNWGLLALFSDRNQSHSRPRVFVRPRIVEMTDLFAETETFKNDKVKRQVEQIQSETRKELAKLKGLEENSTKVRKR